MMKMETLLIPNDFFIEDLIVAKNYLVEKMIDADNQVFHFSAVMELVEESEMIAVPYDYEPSKAWEVLEDGERKAIEYANSIKKELEKIKELIEIEEKLELMREDMKRATELKVELCSTILKSKHRKNTIPMTENQNWR